MSGTPRRRIGNATVDQLLRHRLSARHGASGVVIYDDRLTYGELNRRAN
ncbi:MAG: hypothetical protein R3A44_02485 [Caldilineaceae bacterium]